jgi:acyl-CoA thioesterase
MPDIKAYFNSKDSFANYCGIEITDVSPGQARAKMDIRDHHLNGLRTVHGGAIFTLGDLAFAAACNSHGTIAVGLNANVAFVKAVSAGTLYAEARELSLGGKIATYVIDITSEQGELVATFNGMAYRKKELLP